MAAFATPAQADTTVSLTFDDGQASQFQVKDMLASHGMKGTFFVNSAKVGTSSFYMTWPQVDAIAAAGNEIGGHTLTHVDLTDTSISETERRRQVCEDRQNLIARGYDPIDFAYPNGWGDALAESIVSDCGYTIARRVGGIVSPNWCPTCGEPHAESLPPEDPYLVRTPAFGSGEITLSALQNVIMQAEFGGGWVPIVFHGVCTTACDEGWVKPTTLAAFMDWLQPRAAQGTVVRAMRQALQPAPPPDDTTPPDTSITSGPSGTVTSASASLSFSSTEAGSFECSLDTGAWGSCTSPKSYSGLSNGQHTFSVRGKDSAGNVDASPATRTWTVDVATGPSPPARTVVSLTFDDGQATQYPVKDMLASHGMKGTFFVNSAKVGTSGFYMTWAQVDAVAADGNEIAGHTLTHVDLMDTSVSEAERRRQVCEDRQNLIARGYDPVDFAYPSGWGDALAESMVSDCGYTAARRIGGLVSPGWCPTCGDPHAETLPPEDPYLVRTPSFGTGEITLSALQNAVTQAELGGGWVPLVFHGVCDSACGEGWVRPSTLSALMDWLQPRAASTGTAVRTMRAAMGAGSPPPPTAPDTSITSGPSGTVGATTASFGFSATEAGSSFECQLDAGAWGACTSPQAYSGLTGGSHTFSVRAKDAAGNQDGSPASRTWTIDTSAPDTSITSGPTGTANSASASFAFSATKAGSTFECKLDAGAWAACSSPKAYSGLANGSHTFSVRAKDSTGNVDATPATRTWAIDTVAPNTSITSGPSGNNVTGSSATFAFTSTEAGSTFECRLDGGAWSACTSPKTYTGISIASHTFAVRAKDAVGNVDGSPATRSWKRRR